MKTYKFIPYDKNLVLRARELRGESTEAEKVFWSEVLKNKKLSNYKFTRQKPIGNFVLDFYCARFKLGIEIDGGVHNFQTTRDKERDDILKHKFGIRIVRYKNEEIFKDQDKIIEDIIKVISSFPPDKGD